MRRPLLTAALLGACLAAPALADVTVRYRPVLPENAPARAREQMPELTVSADESGQGRIEMQAPGTPAPGARQPGIALITREGVGYVVLNGPQPAMQVVARQDDALALAAQFATPLFQGPAREGVAEAMRQRVEIVPVGPETVSGVRGNLYRIVVISGETRSPPFEIVVATDPRMAPVGREFARLLDAVRPTLVAAARGEPQVFTAARALVGLGAPLRLGSVVRLESISTEDVPDSRFALPGPAMTREQLQAMAAMIMGMRQGPEADSLRIRPGAPPPPAPATPPAPEPGGDAAAPR